MRFSLNKRTLVLTALFIFAFCIRLTFISKGPFHSDTLDLAVTAQKTLDTLSLHYQHASGFPLTVIVGAFFIFIFRLFGITDPVFCVNFMSVVCGALGVVLLFFVAEKLFDTRKGIISAMLLAVFPVHVAQSTFGKSFTLSICFSLASAYYLLRFIQEDKKQHLFVSALFLGFCAAARLPDSLVFFPLVCLYFTAGKISYKKIQFFVAFCFIAFVTAAIYYLPMLFDRGTGFFLGLMVSMDGAELLGIFSDANKAAFRWLMDIFRLHGVILALLGFWFMVLKKELRQFIFLLVWFFTLHFFYGNFSGAAVRYMTIAWLPLIIAQGSFLGSFKGKGFYAAIFYVFIAGFISFSRFAHVLEFRHRHALQPEFAIWASAQAGEDSVIICLDEGAFFAYYAHRRVLYRPIGRDREIFKKYFDDYLDPFLEQGRRVYIIGSAVFFYNPGKVFQNMLYERYDIDYVGKKLNEDWHNYFLQTGLFEEDLYLIKKKPSAQARFEQ